MMPRLPEDLRPERGAGGFGAVTDAGSGCPEGNL